ncbi:NPCBM/NEW2 domain-containing protein [Stratiformator vulcanicus]|uniref:NPCBM/NEW2 domain-containing protein n=1 Tax=Stratiformator vulcanicus TaxID=2527980 RepID=UPI002877B866|nr:NPCBM/NEW2 domain-containing protein [Stratiformator vulcanicus]
MTTTDGVTYSGKLKSLDDQAIAVGENLILRENISSLSFPTSKDFAAPGQWWIDLVDQSRLPLSRLTIADDSLSGTLCVGGEQAISIPLDTVVSLRSNRPREDATALFAEVKPYEDRLQLTSGLTYAGRLMDWGSGSVMIEVNDETISFAPSDIALFEPAPVLRRDLKPVDQWAYLTLRNGGVLVTTSVTLDDNSYRISPRFDDQATLTLLPNGLSKIEFFGPNRTLLTMTDRKGSPSDLEDLKLKTLQGWKFAESSHERLLGPTLKPQANRNFAGERLHIGEQIVPFGIITGSRSTIVWGVDGTYSTFTATIGLERSAGPNASVEFIVRGDERELYRSDLISKRGQTVSVGPIDLSGVRRLELITDFGDGGDLGDRAIWALPVLSRPPR